MSCPSCKTFNGDPCPICRTADRIKWVVSEGGLVVSQETEALRILRDCAGQLQDLVETTLAAGSDAETHEGEDKKESKKRKTKDKSKKSRHKDRNPSSEERPGERGSPDEEGTSGKVKKTKEEINSPEDKQKRKRRKTTNPGGPSSGAREAPKEEPIEELQAVVDSYATTHPGAFELGTLPRREGREETPHRDNEADRDLRRPREPDHPPPGRGEADAAADNEEESTEIPRRRYEPPKKKNKGSKHRERGRFFRGRPNP
eukprot:s282_g20.t1